MVVPHAHRHLATLPRRLIRLQWVLKGSLLCKFLTHTFPQYCVNLCSLFYSKHTDLLARIITGHRVPSILTDAATARLFENRRGHAEWRARSASPLGETMQREGRGRRERRMST